ncbi:hypothetical protein EZS27_030511 [termite gut metagenome]|uniref:Uncharacterized protein n=1 Tax=termite gut metagenome TaxID=433724 RepID=A0A5J4QEK2_9ZZZZ
MTHATKVIILGKAHKNITTHKGGGFLSEIKDVWLVIGTDFKHKKLEPNCCGRFPLGEKAIGRLGVHKLGNKITLISKSNKIDENTKQVSKEVKLTIDWTTLNQTQTIDDFAIEVTENDMPNYFTGRRIGTKIIIEGLKTKWDRRQIREVYRNLTSLNSPFSGANDAFKVDITSNSDLFVGLPSFEDIKESGFYFGHCVLKNDRIEDFRYEFKPWTSLYKVRYIFTINHLSLLP